MSELEPIEHSMLGAYVTDALDEDERASFERHLVSCKQCESLVAGLAETVGELTQLVQADPPPSIRASLLAKITAGQPLRPQEPE